MKPAAELRQVSFSFYPQDVQQVNDLVVSLRDAGLPVRRAKVLRALIHSASLKQLVAYASRLADEQAQRAGPRETDNICDHPAVDLPPADIDKLNDAVTELTRKNVPATQAFVVRAALRAMPDEVDFTTLVKKFAEKFPDRPRGRAAASYQAKRHT